MSDLQTRRERECGSCAFFQSHSQTSPEDNSGRPYKFGQGGQCHEGPPASPRVTSSNGFPNVIAGHWCGQWKRAGHVATYKTEYS